MKKQIIFTFVLVFLAICCLSQNPSETHSNPVVDCINVEDDADYLRVMSYQVNYDKALYEALILLGDKIASLISGRDDRYHDFEVNNCTEEDYGWAINLGAIFEPWPLNISDSLMVRVDMRIEMTMVDNAYECLQRYRKQIADGCVSKDVVDVTVFYNPEGTEDDLVWVRASEGFVTSTYGVLQSGENGCFCETTHGQFFTCFFHWKDVRVACESVMEVDGTQYYCVALEVSRESVCQLLLGMLLRLDPNHYVCEKGRIEAFLREKIHAVY